MESQLSQDSLDSFLAPPEASEPSTPIPPHASLPPHVDVVVAAKIQEARFENATSNMTLPSTIQAPQPNRPKTRTPTPAVSHISTPPPTDGVPTQLERPASSFVGTMTAEDIANATPEELRSKMNEALPALHEARTSAAHYKLQYQMLLQESAAAMDRMGVEMRMAQCETDILQTAEQQRAISTSAQPSPHQDPSMKAVHIDFYNAMVHEITELKKTNSYLSTESQHQQKLIWQQESEIASLTDRVTLMRDRIRENREHLNRYKRTAYGIESTPRSEYSTSYRQPHGQEQQGFAALLHATEMASQEAVTAPNTPRHGKKSHIRNTHSLSSLPSTPNRARAAGMPYQTPPARQPPLKVPSTAPLPRTSSLRTPDVYTQPLPVPPPGPPSDDGTVSASDANNDSEAETDIIEHTDEEIPESQASQVASAMLKHTARKEKRESFREMLGSSQPTHATRVGANPGGGLMQSKLFGSVTKHGIERSHGQEPPAKKIRLGGAVGLGIAGVRD